MAKSDFDFDIAYDNAEKIKHDDCFENTANNISESNKTLLDAAKSARDEVLEEIHNSGAGELKKEIDKLNTEIEKQDKKIIDVDISGIRTKEDLRLLENDFETTKKTQNKKMSDLENELIETSGDTSRTKREVEVARHSDLTGQHASIDSRIETFEKKVVDEYKPKQTLDEVTLARKSSLYGQSSNLNERLEKSEITVNNNFQSPRITQDNGDPIESWNSGDFLTKLQQMSAGKKIVHVSSLVSGLPTTHTYKMEIYKKEIVGTNYGEGYVKAYSYSTKKEYTRFFDKNTISDWMEVPLDLKVDTWVNVWFGRKDFSANGHSIEIDYKKEIKEVRFQFRETLATYTVIDNFNVSDDGVNLIIQKWDGNCRVMINPKFSKTSGKIFWGSGKDTELWSVDVIYK